MEIPATRASGFNLSPRAADSGSWLLGDRNVYRLGLGAMRLTGTDALHAGVPRDRDTSIALVRRAIELGVNHIDTAAIYFSALRSANEIVNAALATSQYREEVVVATKVGPRRDRAGQWADAARPDELRGDVEENLRQLGRDQLDLVYLRNMGWDSITEHFGALAELRDAGLICNLGVSAVSAQQVVEAQAIAPVTAVQNRFGIGQGTSPDVLRFCGQAGIAFVPFFAIATPSAQVDESAEVLAVAAAHEATPQQIRLAWTLAQGTHVLGIPGTGNPGHLEANIAAGAIRLTHEEIKRLDSAA